MDANEARRVVEAGFSDILEVFRAATKRERWYRLSLQRGLTLYVQAGNWDEDTVNLSALAYELLLELFLGSATANVEAIDRRQLMERVIAHASRFEALMWSVEHARRADSTGDSLHLEPLIPERTLTALRILAVGKGRSSRG